jgi:hypothetical protein
MAGMEIEKTRERIAMVERNLFVICGASFGFQNEMFESLNSARCRKTRQNAFVPERWIL